MGGVGLTGKQVIRSDRLDQQGIGEVLALTRTAGDADGAEPLDEAVLLRLRDPQARAVHLEARTAEVTLIGYAHLDISAPADGIGLDLVVHPAYRRNGVGRALAEEAAGVVGALYRTDEKAIAGPVRAWAHGDHPAAAALAVDLGFRRARVLWQLRRPLTTPLPGSALPDGVSLRPFRPGEDDAAWLSLNARAFADHPEQGRWRLADLKARLAEPWFDPEGFLLAVESSTGRLHGFHWTKVHQRAGTSPIGEVYVLGIDPSAQGSGLGRALTAAGLAYLRDRRRLDRVMLYVDESNTAAVALYRRLGFAHWCAHVSYQQP